jgi:hypothetical protein
MQRPGVLRAALASATLILAGSCGVHEAAATTISYSSYAVPYGDGVSITAPSPPAPVSGEAGQILLHVGTSTIIAWCIDIAHYLQGSGTYSIGGSAKRQDRRLDGRGERGSRRLGVDRRLGRHYVQQERRFRRHPGPDLVNGLQQFCVYDDLRSRAL